MTIKTLFIGLFLSIFILAGELAANTPPFVIASINSAAQAMRVHVESAAVSAQMSASCTVANACSTQCGLCGFVTEQHSLYRFRNTRVETEFRLFYPPCGFGFRIFRPPKGEERMTT